MGQALVQQACTCNALPMQHYLLPFQYCMTNEKVKIDVKQCHLVAHRYVSLMYEKFKKERNV